MHTYKHEKILKVAQEVAENPLLENVGGHCDRHAYELEAQVGDGHVDDVAIGARILVQCSLENYIDDATVSYFGQDKVISLILHIVIKRVSLRVLSSRRTHL